MAAGSMMTDDQILKVVQAHKEGSKIQVRSRINSPLVARGWFDVLDGGLNPDQVILWNFYANDYRVAPEPRKPREWTMAIVTDGVSESVRVREIIDDGIYATTSQGERIWVGSKREVIE